MTTGDQGSEVVPSELEAYGADLPPWLLHGRVMQ